MEKNHLQILEAGLFHKLLAEKIQCLGAMKDVVTP